MHTREQIDDFLAQRRIAVVGVSRNPKDFTRAVYRELRQRHYDVVPVNPNAPELEGQPCYSHVQDITPPVDAALLMTKSSATGDVVRDCAEAGIKRVWMHRGAGVGSVSSPAVDLCDSLGISVIAGECPFMFLPKSGFPHSVHRFFKRITGTYPR